MSGQSGYACIVAKLMCRSSGKREWCKRVVVFCARVRETIDTTNKAKARTGLQVKRCNGPVDEKSKVVHEEGETNSMF